MPTFYDVGGRNYKSLYRVLATTQARQATEPRDKVFSILSLLPRGLYDFLTPDYALSIEQTFALASRVCIEIDNEMNVLAGAGLMAARSDNLNLPSWVTDWTQSHSKIYQWQNLSRSLGRATKDAKLRRARNVSGAKLDKSSRSICIRGVTLGRFRVDDGGQPLSMH